MVCRIVMFIYHVLLYLSIKYRLRADSRFIAVYDEAWAMARRAGSRVVLHEVLSERMDRPV